MHSDLKRYLKTATLQDPYNMIIAKEKKKNNIAEYVLYMWQVEDIIRANQFDIEAIDRNIVRQFDQPNDILAEVKDWYKNLIEMMTREGVKEKGHLQININTLIDLNDLHARVLSDPSQTQYQQLFTRTYPLIQEFREKSNSNSQSDIELSFSALYSFWLLKLQKRTISKATQEAMHSFSELVGGLSRIYHQRERGEIEI